MPRRALKTEPSETSQAPAPKAAPRAQLPVPLPLEDLVKLAEERNWMGTDEDVEFARSHSLLNEETFPIIRQKLERYLIEEFFDGSHLVMHGGSVVVMVRRLDTVHVKRNEDGSLPRRKPPVYWEVFKSFANWKQKYHNQKIKIPVAKADRGRTSYHWERKNPADVWYDSELRPNFDGIIMEPYPYGREQLASSYLEKMRDSYGENLLNVFDGWPLTPLLDDHGEPMPHKCKLIRKHLHNMFCNGETDVYLWVMAWFAHKVQKPHEKIKTAINITGDEGSGKGLIFKDVMGNIISGSHFVHTGKIEQLIGRFASMDNALMIFADEAIFTADKAQTDAMKTIISEETLTVERKYQDQRMTRSFGDLVISSNQPLIGGISFNDRRNLVVKSKSMAHWPANERKAYFDPIFEEIYGSDMEGLRAFMGVLLKWDLSEYNLRFPPESEARGEQKLMAMDNHTRWWFTTISDENFGPNFGYRGEEILRWSDATTTSKDRDVVPKQVLHKSYLGFCKERGEKYPMSETALWSRLKELCPSMFELGSNVRARLPENHTLCDLLGLKPGDQVRCFVLPTVEEAKDDFRKAFKSHIPEWDGDEEAAIDAAYAAEDDEDARTPTPAEFLDDYEGEAPF